MYLKTILNELSTNSKIGLVFIIVIFTFFWNFKTFTGSSWFLHPDESNTYIVVDNILKHGDMYVKSNNNLNDFVGFDLFGNLTNTIGDDGSFYGLPNKPFGEYLFLGYFLSILGIDSIFYVLSILCFFSLIFIFLFFRKKLSYSVSRSILLVILFMIIPPIIFWSNLVYMNILAFLVFIGGFYYFYGEKYIYQVLSGLLVGSALFMRYEYLIIILIFFLFNLKHILIKRKTVLIIVLLFTFLIGFYNNKYFGSPFYTQYFLDIPEEMIINENHDLSGSIITKFTNFLVNGYNRFFTQDINPNTERLFRNFNMNIYNYFDFLILFIFLFLLKVKYKEKFYLYGLFVGLLYFTYNTIGGYHWGEEHNFYVTVHGRYIIGFYFLFVMSIGFFIKRIGILTSFLLVFYLITTFNINISSEGGLYWLSNRLNNNNNYQMITGNGDLFISNLNNKYIVNGYTLKYESINEENIDTISLILKDLYANGYIERIILCEDKSHDNTYKNLGNVLIEKSEINNVIYCE